MAAEGAPELTEALDAYLSATEAAGAPMPTEPIAESELRRVEEILAPLTLPDEVRAVWRRFQIAPLLPFPGWTPARFALDIRSEANAPGAPALFAVAYESQVELCVDLTAPARSGCPLWEVEIVDGTARRRYRSMAVFFAAAADAVRSGILRWQDGYAQTDETAWTAMVGRWNSRAGRDEGLDVDEVDLNRPLAWPDRWLRAAGLDPEQARPRGPTHDIGTLLSARPEEAATVVGRIVGLAGSTEASRITLEDATGRMAVWVPRATDPFWFAVMRAEVELDLLLLPSVGSGGAWDVEMAARQWGVQRAALGHDIPAAQRLGLEVMQMLDPTTCDAVALAARPAAWPLHR
jgi:hypothetical protein